MKKQILRGCVYCGWSDDCPDAYTGLSPFCIYYEREETDEEASRRMTRENYENQFGKNWH